MITHYYDGHKSITTLLLTVRQGALQEQGVDVSAALSLLSTAPSRILTNMAGKRDSVAGRGGVYHFGARYNYTGKESLGEQKLVPVAMKKSKNSEVASANTSFIKAMQPLSNTAIHCTRAWQDKQISDMLHASGFLCPTVDAASFAFPVGSIALHGCYTVHEDKRDVTGTIWAAFTEAAFFLPEFSSVLRLGPGAVMTFKGWKFWHASIAPPAPPAGSAFQHCVLSFYMTNQQDSQLHRGHAQRRGHVLGPS